MGEFDIAVEDLFANGQTATDPQWYPLKSTRVGGKKKKASEVSGEIQLQFTLADPSNPAAKELDILNKFRVITASSPGEERDDDLALIETDTRDEDEEAEDEEISDETEDLSKPEAIEKRKQRLKIKRLKTKAKARAYEFSGGSDCVGIVFLEIGKITDLPPERNVTRTSFDMDPFVVASLGRKTFRTKIIRHNLNPVYNEKMIFQVMRHEQQYSMSFAVVDRDKLSGNDFIGTADFPLSTIIGDAPEADQNTGLYPFREPPEPGATPMPNKSRFRIPLSRTTSATSLKNMGRPPVSPRLSSTNGPGQPGTPLGGSFQLDVPNTTSGGLLSPAMSNTTSSPSVSAADSSTVTQATSSGSDGEDSPQIISPPSDDPELKEYVIPLNLKKKEKWSDKHPTQLYIRAKYLPYPALRQEFWRSMLKQYDADDTRTISKVELTTMLDTLGSTLKEATIDRFFNRFASENSSNEALTGELTFGQAVVCLEDQLQRSQSKTVGQTVKGFLQSPEPIRNLIPG